jgi:hypothetical protein
MKIRSLVLIFGLLLVGCESPPTSQYAPAPVSEADRALQAKRAQCQAEAAAAMSGKRNFGEAMAAASKAAADCMAR